MSDTGFSKNCYYICMAVAGYSAAGYLVLQRLGLDPAALFPPCRLYQETGYYCMGCGGTRALLAFFQGRLVQSFLYHPAVVLAMAYLVVFIPSQTLGIFTKNRIHGLPLKPVYLYFWAGVILLQWIIKNAIYYYTGIHVI